MLLTEIYFVFKNLPLVFISLDVDIRSDQVKSLETVINDDYLTHGSKGLKDFLSEDIREDRSVFSFIDMRVCCQCDHQSVSELPCVFQMEDMSIVDNIETTTS